MAQVQCTRCGIENDPAQTDGFCDQCGAKLPAHKARFTSEPDHLDEHGLQPDEKGLQLKQFKQSGRLDELDLEVPDYISRSEACSVDKTVEQAWSKAKRHAAGVLFAWAGLFLVCNSILIVVAPHVLFGEGYQPESFEVVITMVLIGTASTIYAGLGVWALFQPTPASLIGLILFVLQTFADVISNPAILKGILLRIAFAAMFIQAINLSFKARALQSERELDEPNT